MIATDTGSPADSATPLARTLPVTLPVALRMLMARTVMRRVAWVPAGASPTRKHTVRPDLTAPFARVITRWTGNRRHEVTDLAVAVPEFRTRIPRMALWPLTRRVRGASTVARRVARVPVGATGMAGTAAKVAVTLRAWIMVTVHAPVPVHAPDQPVKVLDVPAVAVRVTVLSA